jgi:hypothetical protein
MITNKIESWFLSFTEKSRIFFIQARIKIAAHPYLLLEICCTLFVWYGVHHHLMNTIINCNECFAMNSIRAIDVKMLVT